MKEALALEAMFTEEICDELIPAQIQLNNPQIQLTTSQQTIRPSADYLPASGFMRSSTAVVQN